MREATIARNYAEALFELGESSGQTQAFADLIDALAGAIESDDRIHMALDSPRVPKAQKQELLAKALAGRASETFIRFLAAVIKRGRQRIFPAIRTEYLLLVDVKLNRVHAGVAIAREPDKALQRAIATKLSEVLGKEVIPHFSLDAAILGGVIVRVGDRIMDGSLRRKLVTLRRQMLTV